jgi:hypothetical protein
MERRWFWSFAKWCNIKAHKYLSVRKEYTKEKEWTQEDCEIGDCQQDKDNCPDCCDRDKYRSPDEYEKYEER